MPRLRLTSHLQPTAVARATVTRPRPPASAAITALRKQRLLGTLTPTQLAEIDRAIDAIYEAERAAGQVEDKGVLSATVTWWHPGHLLKLFRHVRREGWSRSR